MPTMTTSELDTRIIRQTRNALDILIDGAYARLTEIHRRPNGEIDEFYNDAIDELLAHLHEEVDSRLTSADITE